MKNTKIVSILIITLSALCSQSSQSTIYQWKDEKGQLHFDSNGANEKRKNFSALNKIQSVKWKSENVSFHKTTRPTNKQQKSYQKDLMKKCNKTVKRIDKIHRSLKQPLIATKFDAFQAELRELRWVKRKVC